MSNPSTGLGLRPSRRADGAAPNYALVPFPIVYNYSGTIAKWDPVIEASGYLNVWASGAIFGVFFGCEYLDPNLGYVDWKNSWTYPTLASTTIVTGYVITDPQMIWEVVTTSGANTTQASVGLNAILTGMSTPSPTGSRGYSTARLSTIATTNTYPLRIVGLSQQIGNDNTANNNIVEVMFNNTQWVAGTTGG